MLAVLSIVAILTMAAVPSFSTLLAGSRIEEASGSLRSALELARSEALARGDRVTVCRSTDANAATPVCSDTDGAYGARDWAAGWIVCAKAAASLADTCEATDVVLRRQTALSLNPASARVAVWAPATGALVYGWHGLRLAGPTGVFAIDHATPAATPPSTLAAPSARCLGVNVVGRLRVDRASGGVCP